MPKLARIRELFQPNRTSNFVRSTVPLMFSLRLRYKTSGKYIRRTYLTGAQLVCAFGLAAAERFFPLLKTYYLLHLKTIIYYYRNLTYVAIIIIIVEL